MTNPAPNGPRYTKDLCAQLPKFEGSVSLLGWAYNEERLIEEYLVRCNDLLSRTVGDYEIVIVDDGSTDRTAEIITELQKTIPAIVLLRNEENRNVGYSFRRAVSAATRDYVFWQTVDWSYDISYLRIFLELLHRYDVVAGVRRAPVEAANRSLGAFMTVLRFFGMKHLTRRSDTLRKAIVSVINYALIRALFRVDLSDFQNVVFFPREMIQSFEYESDSSFVSPEGLIRAYWRGASIVEVPIAFIPRKEGEAKGTRPRAIARSVGDIFRIWFEWIVLNRGPFETPGHITRLDRSEWDLDNIL